MELENSIRFYALENASKFNGKCSVGAVTGKILGEDPKRKEDMKEISPKIKEICEEVNKLSVEEQKEELLKLDPDYYEKKKEEEKKRREEGRSLPKLENAEYGKVVTRIAPEPSKYNHFGHAISFLLNYMYAIEYDGKCVLRFEDTNPEKSDQVYVDAMKEDVLEYLDIRPSKTVYVSDHIDKYYEYAEKLIESGDAYTCECDRETISNYRREQKNCGCRDKSLEKVKEEWEKMKKGEFKEESIILRLKISMEHKNAVMRDPIIFRLCYTPHYRQGEKYKVWPVYDFENAVEERELGITHVLRSDEFASRVELQNYIRDKLGYSNPVIKQYARFNVTGAVTKGREIREMIESGEYIGWDDPRLATLRALRRRGFVKETLYEVARRVGMSKTTSNLDISLLESVNRKILDPVAHRHFFIEDPVEIEVKDTPEKEIELDLHPDKKKGGRKFNINGKFFIERKDYESIKEGDMVRLKDCINITKDKEGFVYSGDNVEDYEEKGKVIIHWLPYDEYVDMEMRMPDNSINKGIAEKSVNDLNEGDIIQFERFGFSRLDDKENLKFWYTNS